MSRTTGREDHVSVQILFLFFLNTYEEKLLTTDSASTDRNLLPPAITSNTVVNPRLPQGLERHAE